MPLLPVVGGRTDLLVQVAGQHQVDAALVEGLPAAVRVVHEQGRDPVAVRVVPAGQVGQPLLLVLEADPALVAPGAQAAAARVVHAEQPHARGTVDDLALQGGEAQPAGLLGDEVPVVVVAGDRHPVVVVVERRVEGLQAERLPRPARRRVVAGVEQERRAALVGDGPGDRVHADVVVPVADQQPDHLARPPAGAAARPGHRRRRRAGRRTRCCAGRSRPRSPRAGGCRS